MATQMQTHGTELRQRAIAYRLFATLLSSEVTHADQAATALLYDTCRRPHLDEPHLGLAGLSEALDVVCDAFPKEGDSEGFTRLAAEYTRLFVGSNRGPAAAPYQSEYRGEGHAQSSTTAEMRDYLHVLNLRASQDFGPEDHIAVELSIMAVLVDRGNAQWEMDFLKGRLIEWIPRFAEHLRQSARLPFYPAVVSALEQFLRADEAYLTTLVNTSAN